MSDIVGRLRYPPNASWHAIMEEAAAEIERLRKELQEAEERGFQRGLAFGAKSTGYY